VLHEAYHLIFGIYQQESLKELDKENPLPYLEEEMAIWNKIETYFPELAYQVFKAKIATIYSHGIIG
jgi:hypothetical protein